VRIPRRAQLLALAALTTGTVALAGVDPASASGSARRDPVTDAIVPFQAEVMLIAELGGFPQPLPSWVAQVHAEWRSYTEGMDRGALIEWLAERDGAGQVALGPLQANGPVSGDVVRALSPLPEVDMQVLQAGGQISTPVDVYDHALADLNERGGAAPGQSTAGPTDTVAPLAATSDAAWPAKTPATSTPASKGVAPSSATPAPADTAAETTTSLTAPDAATTADDGTTIEGEGASTDAERPRTDTPTAATATDDGAPTWLPVAAGLGGGTPLVVGLVVVLRRRRRRTTTSDAAMAALLDAGRRMGASLSAIEILRIMVDEARHLTSSDVGLVMLSEDAEARLAASTDPDAVEPTTQRGVVRRVLDTGIAARTVAEGELADHRQAIAAAPLVRKGSVNGVLIVARGPDREYGQADLDVLTHLAPLGAAALVAAEAHDDVAAQTLTDGLTGLANRRRLDQDLPGALADGGVGVGFVMVDVDHFKHYNDTHGHPAGDAVLRTVADVLRASVREGDVVYRYGGEEFCVLLPDTTEREAAEVAERLRQAVEASPIPGADQQPDGRVTVSVGLAMAAAADPSALTDRADKALYEAKHGGRNRVVVSSADDS